MTQGKEDSIREEMTSVISAYGNRVNSLDAYLLMLRCLFWIHAIKQRFRSTTKSMNKLMEFLWAPLLDLF